MYHLTFSCAATGILEAPYPKAQCSFSLSASFPYEDHVLLLSKFRMVFWTQCLKIRQKVSFYNFVVICFHKVWELESWQMKWDIFGHFQTLSWSTILGPFFVLWVLQSSHKKCARNKPTYYCCNSQGCGQIAQWLSSKGCDVSRDEKNGTFLCSFGWKRSGAKATVWKIEDLYAFHCTFYFTPIFHPKLP